MKKWKIEDLFFGIYFLGMIAFLWNLVVPIDWVETLLLKEMGWTLYPGILCACICVSMVTFLPIYFLLRKLYDSILAKKIGKQYKKEAYSFTYYRDQLEDLPPTFLGMCYRKKTHMKRDVSSLLLYLAWKKEIVLEENKIILNKPIKNFCESEICLLEYATMTNTYSYDSFVTHFKNIVERESKDAFLVQEKRTNLSIKVIEILFLVCIFISFFCMLIGSNTLDSFVILFYFGIYFASFLILIVYLNVYTKWVHLERTKRGFDLYKKMIGLKNFLKDFTSIEESSSKEIILREEYLLYALVCGLGGKLEKEGNTLYRSYLKKTM